MFKNIGKLWEKWSKQGLNLPKANDPIPDKPSITLLAFYMMLMLTFCSLIALHFKIELLVATTMCLLAWAMSFIFYKLRRLDKAKIDLDDQSIELESGEGKENETT